MLLAGIPLGEVSTSMTINAPAAVLLLLYQLVAEEQGVRPATADRHDPERRAEGVHRPRDLHLSAAGVAAAGQRHLRATAGSTCRGGTPSRSPATTWPRRGRRRRRRSPSPWPTGSPTSRRRWPPGWRWTTSLPGCRSSSCPAPRCWRRWRSSARPGGSGPRSMRERFGARNPKSVMLRFHTQTAGVQLTAQQPEVNLVRVAVQALGRGAGRHPVAAHQLLRRGDRAADAEVGPAGAAHPAGARVRDRPDQDRRPVRRLVRGGVADRRPRGGGAAADGQVAERGGAVAAIEEGFQKSEIERSAYAGRPGDRHRRAGGGRASTGSRWRTRSRTSRCGSIRPSRPRRRERLAALRAERDAAAVDRGARRAARGGRAAPTTCCVPLKQALAPGPRSARSATRCARSGAPTSRPSGSDRTLRRRARFRARPSPARRRRARARRRSTGPRPPPPRRCLRAPAEVA